MAALSCNPTCLDRRSTKTSTYFFNSIEPGQDSIRARSASQASSPLEHRRYRPFSASVQAWWHLHVDHALTDCRWLAANHSFSLQLFVIKAPFSATSLRIASHACAINAFGSQPSLRRFAPLSRPAQIDPSEAVPSLLARLQQVRCRCSSDLATLTVSPAFILFLRFRFILSSSLR